MATFAPASPQNRFRLRETLAGWNRALDRSDLDALQPLTAPGAVFAYDGTVYEGRDALVRFVHARAGAGDIVQRTHVNHLQAWHQDGGFRVRAMAMIVHMRTATTPFGDGAPTVAWVGYTDDLIRDTDTGPVIAARRFARWDGFLPELRHPLDEVVAR